MTRPASLTALLSWYRDEVDAAIPQRIHDRDIDQGGAPQWHGAFRAYLTAHPAAEDRDGAVICPLRYWMWRLGGRRELYLHRLAASDFDWRLAAGLHGILDDDAAHDYARECLRRLHRLMYADDGTPSEPSRPKLGDCEVRGCPVRTARLRCAEHENVRLALDKPV